MLLIIYFYRNNGVPKCVERETLLFFLPKKETTWDSRMQLINLEYFFFHLVTFVTQPSFEPCSLKIYDHRYLIAFLHLNWCKYGFTSSKTLKKRSTNFFFLWFTMMENANHQFGYGKTAPLQNVAFLLIISVFFLCVSVSQ